MNNKRRGMNFEKEMCDKLSNAGYWAHFMCPNPAGAQPFDIIACKDGQPLAMDCKTSALPYITMSRLEDNQIMAFELWMRCGNPEPKVAVKYNDDIYLIPYGLLKEVERAYLSEKYRWRD